MIGRTIGHYLITAELGAGGMGTVYRADDLQLQRPVAIKFVSPHLSRDPESHQRLLREARSASALDHPHIGVVHEVAETDDGQLYIVMAVYEGGTLRQRLEQGPLPIDEALRLGRQITEGLAAAHAAGIVHRDLKPENILLTRDGQVRIVDFGLAKSRGQTRMTRTGSAAGTVAYMSPEQARGDEVDARTDLFSLGVILYEMLGGRPPFRGESDSAVLYQVVHEEPPGLEGLRAEVPQSMRQLVTRLLAKDAAGRYPDAAAVLADLGSGRVRRRWPRRRVLLTAATAVAVLGMASCWAWPRYLSETARFRREIVRLQNDKRPLVIAVAPIAATGEAGRQQAEMLHGVCVQELNRLLSGDRRVRIVAGESSDVVRTDDEAGAFAERSGADVVLWGNISFYGDTLDYLPSVTSMPRVLLEQSAFPGMTNNEKDSALHYSGMRGGAAKASALAVLVAASYHALRGDYSRSAALIHTVDDVDPILQIQKARLLERIGHSDEAYVVLAQLATRYPSFALGRLFNGRCLIDQERRSEAIKEFGAALEINPCDYEALNHLGYALEGLGRNGEAEAAFLRAADAASDQSAEAFSNKGEALTNLNQWDEAIPWLEKAVQLRPYWPAVYRTALAHGYTQVGRVDDARRELEMVLLIVPRSKHERRVIVDNLIRAGRLGEANEYLAENRALMSTHGYRHYVQRWRLAMLRRDLLTAEAAACSLMSSGVLPQYCAIRQWLVTRAVRGLVEAQNELRTTLTALPASREDRYAPLTQYLLDEMDEDALFEDRAGETALQRRGRLCEFNYFVGMRHLLDVEGRHEGREQDRHREIAIKCFRQCLVSDVRDYYEYVDASLELQRLQGRSLK